MWPDRSMKPHYLMNKTECLAELGRGGMKLMAKDYTLAETRVLVKELRARSKLTQQNGTQDNTMAMINKANKTSLRELCQRHHIPVPDKASVGEMRLALKEGLVSSGVSETEVTFGKHCGKSFQSVLLEDPQYLEWAASEVATQQGNSEWRLRQLVYWFERTKHGATAPVATSSRRSLAPGSLSSREEAMAEQMQHMAAEMENMKAQLAQSRETRRKPAPGRMSEDEATDTNTDTSFVRVKSPVPSPERR